MPGRKALDLPLKAGKCHLNSGNAESVTVTPKGGISTISVVSELKLPGIQLTSKLKWADQYAAATSSKMGASF